MQSLWQEGTLDHAYIYITHKIDVDDKKFKNLYILYISIYLTYTDCFVVQSIFAKKFELEQLNTKKLGKQHLISSQNLESYFSKD